MKKIGINLLFIAFILLSGCKNHNSEKPDAKSEMDSKPLKIKVSELASGQDLACGMKLEDGAIGDTATYQGKTYGFCSSECKAEFLKDPQAHLTQK